jgi:hypothetical protein
MTTLKFTKVEDLEGKPTLGQQLADTEQLHQKQEIEVGEFVEEVGNKEVMKEIWRQIDERKEFPQWRKKFYVVVWLKRSAVLHRVIEVLVHCRHTRLAMEPGLTMFSYDPKRDLLLLEWVLPNKSAFKTFLQTREYSDPFLMECIDKYLAGTA